MVIAINVKGMSCDHCVRRVISAVKDSTHTENVNVDLKSGKVSFNKPDNITSEQFTEAIEAAGYQVEK